MVHVSQSRLAALCRAVQKVVGVGHANMRAIFTLLAVKVLTVVGMAFGLKPLSLAHAMISVLSTEQCSFDNNGAPYGSRSNAAMNSSSTVLCRSRSRLFVNIVASHTITSGCQTKEPTRQQIVVDLLHQLQFSPLAPKGLQ